MSRSSRLISAGLPAPSRRTTSKRRRRSVSASSTCAKQLRLALVVRRPPRGGRSAAPSARPGDPVALLGLSRIGFMATSGSMPAANAWAACARPISWPSTVTNELSDMFWALNGATRTPRRCRARHRPETTWLLPTSLPVPHTISAPCTTAPPRGGPGPARRAPRCARGRACRSSCSRGPRRRAGRGGRAGPALHEDPGRVGGRDHEAVASSSATSSTSAGPRSRRDHVARSAMRQQLGQHRRRQAVHRPGRLSGGESRVASSAST